MFLHFGINQIVILPKLLKIPKQYLDLCGKPVIDYVLDTAYNSKLIDDIVLVLDKQYLSRVNLSKKKKTHIVKASETFKYLQIKYWVSDTGKVVKRINPVSVTRERRKLKAYKRKLDKGDIPYEDIEQAYKSWMGAYAKLMSKQQVRNMKELYKELFGKEIRWKQKSHSKTAARSKRK